MTHTYRRQFDLNSFRIVVSNVHVRPGNRMFDDFRSKLKLKVGLATNVIGLIVFRAGEKKGSNDLRVILNLNDILILSVIEHSIV